VLFDHFSVHTYTQMSVLKMYKRLLLFHIHIYIKIYLINKVI